MKGRSSIAYALIVLVTIGTMLWGWGFLRDLLPAVGAHHRVALDLRQYSGGERHRKRALG